MAHIPCPACGKQVSKQAPTCPQCGQPIAATTAPPTPKKIVVAQPKSGGSGAAGGILFLLVIGGVALFLTQTDVGKQLFNADAKVTGVPLTDEQRLHGEWEGQGTLDSIEFFPNGDVRIYAALVTHKGKWKLLSGQRLDLETEGVLWGTNKIEWEYKLSGKTLVLMQPNGGLTLKYLKI
jgi:hypothetical protein